MCNYKVVIMAGGRGTRISELFPNIPKPLISISTVEKEMRKKIKIRSYIGRLNG